MTLVITDVFGGAVAQPVFTDVFGTSPPVGPTDPNVLQLALFDEDGLLLLSEDGYPILFE